MEIERKFLVDPEKWKPTETGKKLVQAYLSLNPTVRIRISGVNAFLTIKGATKSISRSEFEYEVPLADAEEMLKMAISNPVEKIRYVEWHKGFCWEVDVFSGKNTGLIMAEIELVSEDQNFPRPEWLLEEVSADPRYYNSYLSGHFFSEWNK